MKLSNTVQKELGVVLGCKSLQEFAINAEVAIPHQMLNRLDDVIRHIAICADHTTL